MKSKKEIIVLGLSVILSTLFAVTSFTGFIIPDFYSNETDIWAIQCVGQDLINLGIVLPFLILTALMIFTGKRKGWDLWAGGILYLIYTYTIYCFNVHFNVFFPEYCFILGLSIYLLIYFFYLQQKKTDRTYANRKVQAITAGYFLILPLIFAFLWLSEIIPSVLNHSVPDSVFNSGLLTNPVHILDLSILLPGIFITGILVFRKHKLGYILTPVILMFCILMSITIAILTLVIQYNGIETNTSVAAVMIAFAVFDLILLILNLKGRK